MCSFRCVVDTMRINCAAYHLFLCLIHVSPELWHIILCEYLCCHVYIYIYIVYIICIDVIMRAVAPLLLCLLSALVEVNSQTAPYLTFMNNSRPNNSYVNFNIVGETLDNNTVQCHTDLGTCCSSREGSHRGDWYFPNGNRLPFPGVDNVYESRRAQLVTLQHRRIGGTTSGIYRCDIETTAVNNNNGRETVYVGLYISGGE